MLSEMSKLSEQEGEPREQQAPDVASASDRFSTERAFLRLSFWQTVLSVVGVFIALVALYAALAESNAVRQQTSAAVWPFVQVSTADFDSGDTAGFTLSLTNVGVGPALVRSVRVVINGEPVSDWDDAVTRLGGTLSDQVGRNSISDSVLRPGQKIDLIHVGSPALARAFQAAIRNPGTSISYCYCSIFSDCWLADSRHRALNPESVEVCPDFGDAKFRN